MSPRTTTALAVAGVAAALAVAPLAATAGTTAAFWHDTTQVAGQTITAGRLAISSLSQTTFRNSNETTATSIEIGTGNAVTMRSTYGVDLAGTDLGAVLHVQYTWNRADNYNYPVPWENGLALLQKAVTATVGSTPTVSATPTVIFPPGADVGSATITAEFLLWTGAGDPPSGMLPAGRGLVRLPSGSSTVQVDLKITNTESNWPWVLGGNISGATAQNKERGHLQASLRQVNSSNALGPWSDTVTANDALPTIWNDNLASSEPRLSADPSVGLTATSGDASAIPIIPSPAPEADAEPEPTPDPVPAPEPEPAPEPTTPVAPEPEPEPEPPVIEEQHAVKPDDLPAGDEVPQEDDPTPPEDELDTFEALDEDTA